MLNELTSLAPGSPARGVAAGVPESRPAAVAAPGAGATPAPPTVAMTSRPIEPSQALDRASRAAARTLFADRDVEVTSFHDQGTGRIVCQVADRASGEVLLQTPPDALLRFFASTRAALADALVRVEA